MQRRRRRESIQTQSAFKANHWQATTGLSLDITAPSLTVMGLRPEPGESEPQAAKDRFHMPRSRHGAYYTP